MRVWLIFSLVFIVAVGTCAGIELYSHLDVYDEVSIRHVAGRVRRDDADTAEFDTDEDADGNEAGFRFPEEKMEFFLTIKETEVRFDLKLNEQQSAHVPVNLVTKDGIHRYHEEEKQRDYAFYQVVEPDPTAGVMVSCPDFKRPCYMMGQFKVGTETYLMEPNLDKPKLVSDDASATSHKVYKMDPSDSADYIGDTVVTREEASENEDQENNQRRKKRQAEGLNLKIELEMVVDYSIYSYWVGRYNGDVALALSTIEDYYEQVANLMDLRFSSLATSPGDMTFDIVPLQISVVTDSSVDTWISNNLRTHTDGRTLLDASPTLSQFELWAAANYNDTLSDFDAAMCFTRHDLGRFSADGSQATGATLGLARQRADFFLGEILNILCNNNGYGLPAVSIVEDLSTGTTALTASHELAHNMGAAHDTLITACEGMQDFVMDAAKRTTIDASRASNPWTFSPCTRVTIQETTNRLLGSGKNCLLQHSYDVTEYWLVQSSRMLGEIYSISEQCALKEGAGSMRCEFTWEDKAAICHTGIYCLVPGTDQCMPTSVMPGTPCGTASGRCVQGTCQVCDSACKLRKFLNYLRIQKWNLRSLDVAATESQPGGGPQ